LESTLVTVMAPAYSLDWSYLFQELTYGPKQLSDKTLINFREVRIFPWSFRWICAMLLGSIIKWR